MPRVKRGTIHNKRRKNILKETKGYRFGRSTKLRAARDAIFHAQANAFRDRRKKKRDFRGLWQIRIGSAVRPLGISYSKFIDALKKSGSSLNRKVLSELAEKDPVAFSD